MQLQKEILKVLLATHEEARSTRVQSLNPNAILRVIRRLDKSVKIQNVSSEVSFLFDKKYVTKEESDHYKITDLGTDFLNGEIREKKNNSIYIQSNSGNINAISGDGSHIHQIFHRKEYGDLYNELQVLTKAIQDTTELVVEKKQDIIADISTIQSQLTKSNPDKTIIKKAWAFVQGIVTVGDLAGLFVSLAPKIATLIGS